MGFLSIFQNTKRTEQRKHLLSTLDDIKRQFVQIRIGYSDRDIADETTRLITKESYLNLETDRYVEVAKHIFDRVVLSPEDIRFGFEDVFVPYLKEIDFSRNIVILSKFKADGRFGRHYHLEEATFQIVDGKVNISDSVLLQEDDRYTIPPRTMYVFNPVTDGRCILCLKNI